MAYERLKEFLDRIGLQISSGGINHLIHQFTAKATPFYEQIRSHILTSKRGGYFIKTNDRIGSFPF